MAKRKMMEEHSPCVQITSNCSAFCWFCCSCFMFSPAGKKVNSPPPSSKHRAPATRSRRGTERQGVWMLHSWGTPEIQQKTGSEDYSKITLIKK